MYRLLIVDDEPFITDGLVELFQGLDHLQLDIYSAYSAMDALSWLKKVKIDIVLTDICMPDMNGLELQDEVNSRWPRCRMIFLTAHSDFEYVKSAMRNDGTDYLLKTEGDGAIIKAVKKAIKSINNEIKNENIISKAKDDLERVLPILQKEYLLDILHGAETSLHERREHFNQLQLELLVNQPILLLLGRVDVWDPGITISERNKKLYGVHNVVNEYLEISTQIISIHYEGSTIIWFIQPRLRETDNKQETYDSATWQRTISFVQGTLDSIQDKCKELMNLSLSFVVESQPIDWKDLYERFTAMRFMLNKGFGLDREILLVDSYKQKQDSSHSIYSPIARQQFQIDIQLRKLELLKNYFENGDKEKFVEIYNEMMGCIKQMEYDMQIVIIEIYYSLVAFFIPYINRWNLWGDIAYEIDLNKLTKMEVHTSFEDTATYFQELALIIFRYRSDSQISSTNKVILYINSYIEEDVGKDLSLIRLSELVHFNPTYLSRLYKQVTGKTLSEYITEVKFNKSIEMLKQSDIKIHEIATEIGFKTPSYFTRFFKKISKVTPQEYRDSLSI